MSIRTAPTEPDHCGSIGEDPHHAAAALDLLVDPLKRVGRPYLAPVGLGARGERENLGLGLVPQRRDLGECLGDLVADLVPRLADGLGVRLGKDRAKDGGDHVGVGLGDVRQQVAGESGTGSAGGLSPGRTA